MGRSELSEAGVQIAFGAKQKVSSLTKNVFPLGSVILRKEWGFLFCKNAWVLSLDDLVLNSRFII